MLRIFDRTKSMHTQGAFGLVSLAIVLWPVDVRSPIRITPHGTRCTIPNVWSPKI
jgi:hypothetical protein